MTTNDQPKVTVGFKVTQEQKRAISDTAQKLNMNTSQYLEGMVFQNHATIQELSSRKIQISAEQEAKLFSLLQPLRDKYPKLSDLQLIAGGLKVAADNENRILSNKIKKYL